ncbi:MAG: DUF192 domain-containing protein [Verrucomicrobiota bacterium]
MRSTYSQTGAGTIHLNKRFDQRTRTVAFGLICLLGWFSACSGEANPSQEFQLKTRQIKVSETPLTVEVADTEGTMARGLMYRKELAGDRGMLFVFPRPHRASFWMKNTFIPLSIAYLNSEGTILEIYRMKPLDQTSIASASMRIQYALEVNQGWFEHYGIKIGDRVTGLPKPYNF